MIILRMFSKKEKAAIIIGGSVLGGIAGHHVKLGINKARYTKTATKKDREELAKEYDKRAKENESMAKEEKRMMKAGLDTPESNSEENYHYYKEEAENNKATAKKIRENKKNEGNKEVGMHKAYKKLNGLGTLSGAAVGALTSSLILKRLKKR